MTTGRGDCPCHLMDSVLPRSSAQGGRRTEPAHRARNEHGRPARRLRWVLSLATALMVFPFLTCGRAVVDRVPPVDTPPPTFTPAPTVQGQPRTALLNGVSFSLEVAADGATRTKGLSNRASLPRTSAMLFVFTSEQQLTFWMKDTLIPLDIVFMDRTLKIVDIQTMKPQPGAANSELLLYTSKGAASYALEMNAGLARELDLQVGQTVALR